ncbi:MAG: TRAP transporter small permease [Burkholderiales bacterium]|nr:TRAP transporter small permease [Burkholderiales bacterium]
MNEHTDPIKPAAEEPPRIPVKIEEFFAAMAMALICLITFANVLVRYFTDESFAFTEEFSVFLMVVLTFVGTAAAFAKNTHIRMTFLVEKLPPRTAHYIEIVVMAAAAVLFGIIVWYGIRLLADDWQYETTSPGIGIPQWIYTLWLPVLCAMIALRIVGRIMRLVRRKV